ncbi:MAG: DUF4255 domain-containing protein [Myxococcales bacterium]|nr:DUF4255 domain-containing protein [Myxococcales bacterium]
MAGTLVISEVGDTLLSIVRTSVQGLVPDANVRLASVDEVRTLVPAPDPAISVFLYNVGIQAETRNAPPKQGFDRPPLTLELRYLVTPWSDDARSAHEMCGHILRGLYDNAHVAYPDLQGTSWSEGDTLQVLLESLPVSEHYNIWEPADIPYKLSLSYLVRVVGLDPGTVAGGQPITQATFGGTP